LQARQDYVQYVLDGERLPWFEGGVPAKEYVQACPGRGREWEVKSE